MARQPKVDFGSIVQSKNVNGSSIPETEAEPIPEPPISKKRSYPSREGKVPVQFFLNKDAHRQLKIISAETDKSHQDILIEALNAWFLMNDKPPIA